MKTNKRDQNKKWRSPLSQACKKQLSSCYRENLSEFHFTVKWAEHCLYIAS